VKVDATPPKVLHLKGGVAASGATPRAVRFRRVASSERVEGGKVEAPRREEGASVSGASEQRAAPQTVQRAADLDESETIVDKPAPKYFAQSFVPTTYDPLPDEMEEALLDEEETESGDEGAEEEAESKCKTEGAPWWWLLVAAGGGGSLAYMLRKM